MPRRVQVVRQRTVQAELGIGTWELRVTLEAAEMLGERPQVRGAREREDRRSILLRVRNRDLELVTRAQ